MNKMIVGCMNSAQCLLHSVIRVHEQYELLFISLNALFMGHKEAKNTNTGGENANPNAHLVYCDL